MSQTEKVKEMLVEMLRWFHSFCKEHSLQYYMIGGTMLGAARHRGFIPWDDDIDVGMPREDYEKLETLIGNKRIGAYYFETTKSEAREYTFTYGKLFNTQTTLIENRKLPVRRGIYIDVFPLDGVADTLEEAKEYYAPIAKLRTKLAIKVLGIRKNRSMLKNVAALMGYFIPRFILDEKKLISQIDTLCSKRSFYNCAYSGNLNGAWGIKEVMPVEYYGQPTIYKFEGIEAYGVERYDEYLTNVYGNWRQLPPEEKRITHHDNIEIDLNKAYM